MTITLTTKSRPLLVKWSVLGLLSYWLLYALLAPVTIYDAHVYNVARLLVIRKGGFFGDHVWNVFAQISYPWSFDAVHYPFVLLGAGYDLPSFACLLGTLVVLHQLVGHHYGARVAWWCDLALLAMPTVVYQATSTKNDFAGVFSLAVWFYALCRWRKENQRIYLLWIALALAFNAGSKLSGLPTTALLSLYTLWAVRDLPRRQILEFVGALAIFFVLFGSAETYLNNYLLFKAPLGPPAEIRFHRNIDGVAGGIANFIRYFFGTMNVGVDACNPQSPVPALLGDAGRATLHFVGLDNVGYRRDYDDTKFSVLKMGLEAASDYGPVGALALITALCLSITRTPQDPLWKLSICGLAALSLTCMTVGWMPWNNRFLLLPFILFGTTFTLWMLRAGPRARLREILLSALLLYAAIVYPLHSYNRKPADILTAVTHREVLELSERPKMREVVDDLKAKVRSDETQFLLLTAGEDSWTYDILKIKGLEVLPTPNLNANTLANAVATTHASHLLVLTLNRVLDSSLSAELIPINSYAETNTYLYEWKPANLRKAEASQDLVVRLSDGWYAEENSSVGTIRWMSLVGNLNEVAAHAGTLVIQARLHSIVPDNAVDLLIDGQRVTSVLLPGTDWQECLLRAPLAAGPHHLALCSHQPGVQPPGDSRNLTVCMTGFQANLMP